MLWPIFCSVIVILTALASRYPQRRSIHRNGAKIRSGLGTLPVLGNAIKFLQPRHVLFDWFVRCQRELGLETFTISIPSLPPGVVIHDPRNLEYVLKNESTITKGQFFRKRSWDLFGHGIINSDGDLWKKQRKAGQKFFAGGNLDTLIEQVLPEAYMQTRAALSKHAMSGDALDMEALLLDLTTIVVGRMAYDMRISASSPFSRAFDYASDRTGRRFQNPLYSITEALNGSKFRSSLSEVRNFGQQIVLNAEERRRDRQASKLNVSTEISFGSLVDSLMDTFDGHRTLTADAALNFLSAGRDTTAQSLTWTFYSLMRHHNALQLLREEIDAKFPHHDLSRPLNITPADLQPTALPVTMSVFNESLRLHPPVPFEVKQCQVDTTLPDGAFLPASSIIVWCIWSMNRSRELWGDDSGDFRPGRWLKCPVETSATDTDTLHICQGEELKLLHRSPFEFPVFNGGPRACLGKKMAELMACWLLVQICREFDFEEITCLGSGTDGSAVVVGGGSVGRPKEERRSKNSLTLPMEGGLPCYVRLRGKGLDQRG